MTQNRATVLSSPSLGIGISSFIGHWEIGHWSLAKRFPLPGHAHHNFLPIGRGRLFLDSYGTEEAGVDQFGAKIGDLLRVSHGSTQGEISAATHGKSFNPGSRRGRGGEGEQRVQIRWL